MIKLAKFIARLIWLGVILIIGLVIWNEATTKYPERIVRNKRMTKRDSQVIFFGRMRDQVYKNYKTTNFVSACEAETQWYNDCVIPSYQTGKKVLLKEEWLNEQKKVVITDLDRYYLEVSKEALAWLRMHPNDELPEIVWSGIQQSARERIFGESQ